MLAFSLRKKLESIDAYLAMSIVSHQYPDWLTGLWLEFALPGPCGLNLQLHKSESQANYAPATSAFFQD